MIPELNHVLFYFAALFAVNITIISEESTLLIDRTQNTARIEYYGLITPEKDAKLVEAALQGIIQSEQLDDYYTPMQLLSLNFYQKGQKINAELNFTFSDQDALWELLYFSKVEQGQPAYVILEQEKLIATNGKLVKAQNLEYIQWDNQSPEIRLSLRLRKSVAGRDSMVSLTNYWQVATR
ncbi:MAG: hypothetical protein OER04_10590 [Cyclobacteriaceae bacterium]|nr:hypothetical protein [Cyclobacteriaceae bacterium]